MLIGAGMETKTQVKVVVLGNSESEICRGGWGPRRSSEETTEITKGLLDRLYGDAVSIEYYDMSIPEDATKQAELISRVPGNRQFFPMVFIDGELKAVGSAEYNQILYLVREVIN